MPDTGPTVASSVTLHTLWQALTGGLPPLALRPLPLPTATLDSRAVAPESLFVAQRGQKTDGHRYIGPALQAGARAVICEPQGRADAAAAGALIVDCTTPDAARSAHVAQQLEDADARFAFIVPNGTRGLQEVGGFQRAHRTRPDLLAIGVTGSVGKTSTKELTAAVMRQRFATLHSAGNLNSEQGLPLTLLGLDTRFECTVLEMGMYALGEIDTLCRLARPRIGIVTNVGPVHLERLETIENIAGAKSELPRNLPPADEGGVAILNWDDARVRAMAGMTRAQVFRYGLTEEADLWADEIKSAGMEGIRFQFHRRLPSGKIESLHVRVPLLGRHSVHTALRAAAAGIVVGLEWDEIIKGMQSIPAQLRLVTAPGINGCTVIDDTYNASPDSTIAALNLLADLEPADGGRRVAVLGDMLELGDYAGEGHRMVGLRAADVADMLVTVGDLGRAIGEAATGLDATTVHIMDSDREAVDFLRGALQANDLVLVKGSRAVGMDAIVTDILLVPERRPVK